MTDKRTILMILDVLNEYTDSEHIITCNELINKINSKYKTKLDRKIVYRDIDLLIEFGYDISKYKDNGKGYYLATRTFDKSQILLLCNVVHASHFIPKDSSKELIERLLKTQSKYTNIEFKDNVYIENSRKKENKEFFLNIELIFEAITNHKAISFKYTEYNFNKEIVDKTNKRFIVSPYYMISDGNIMFLVAKFHKSITFSHFRLDRMRNVKIMDEGYENIRNKKEAYDYAKNKTYMYAGDEMTVKLKCKNKALDSLIDVFGKDLYILNKEKDYFITTLKTTELGIYHLALHYLDSIEILEPIELRDYVKKAIKEALNRYK